VTIDLATNITPALRLQSQVWLDRAGSTPLDICINECANKPRSDRKTVERLLNVLFPKLSQICMPIIIVDTWEPMLIVLRKLQKADEMQILINIEHFELHCAGRPYAWGGWV